MEQDKKKKHFEEFSEEDEFYAVRQNSEYNDENKAAPDNNIFFEGKSNPLSSKGN